MMVDTQNLSKKSPNMIFSNGELRHCHKVSNEIDVMNVIREVFSIKCSEDRRIFTPVARSSHKWKRLYKKRTGVERINGRIDRDYQFEKHSVRGLDKMNMFLTVTFLIYMTMEKAKIKNREKKYLCRMYA